jgi:carboxypeptidase T
MKPVFTILLLFLFLSLSGQTEKYSRIRVETAEAGIHQIALLGITLDNAFFTDNQLILELSSGEIEILRQNKFHFEVLIPDMTGWYVKRNQQPESLTDLHTGSRLTEKWPVPKGFTLGSLGGFSTYEECMVHLDNMYADYPGLITPRLPLGPMMTQEGRPVYLVRMSNYDVQHEKAKVLYTGMIHAREPVSMQHLLYFMYYLLENYESDAQIKYLLDHAELYFVPMLNPDGYIYNQQIAPNGGGMWRKNRRLNEGEAFGVDLNRNFGYQWGYDNIGSSPDPNSLIYRGPAPFSEPETDMIRQLCEEVPFTIALNYHSYSNLLLFPWGYIKAGTPDNYIYSAHAGFMTSESGYATGSSSVVLYVNNGATDDWMYGEQTTKPKIFAYTPEVGSSSDGFWPAINRIIPLCQENMFQSLHAGLLSLHNGLILDKNPSYLAEEAGYLRFDIQRMGFEDGGAFTLSLEPLSEWIVEIGQSVAHSNLDFLEIVSDSIDYALLPSTPYGTQIRFLVTLCNGHFQISDTISKFFGMPDTLFYDAGSNLDQWIGDWGISQQTYVSPPSCIADSPEGNYAANANTSITTTSPVDLTHAAWAELSYWAKWDIVTGWDYVQIQASTDDGKTWTPLEGEFTIAGSSYQLPGQPLYEGSQDDWVQEKIDLSDFLGESVLFRFVLKSNIFITAQGFFFDDFTITAIPVLEILAADFTSDAAVILEGSDVQFYDQSSGNPDSWLWHFQGGEPVSSNQQNPLVYYATPGSFDVSLNVTNEEGSNMIEFPGFLLVLDSVLCRPQVYAGADTIIQVNQTYMAVEAQADNFLSLIWTTSGDGSFDNDTIMNPTYTPGSQDIAQQQVMLTLNALPHYDVCSPAAHTMVLSIDNNTGVEIPDSSLFSIYPNPTSRFITIDTKNVAGTVAVEIISLTGQLLLSQHFDKAESLSLDLKKLNKGIYLLRFTTSQSGFVKKIVLIE